MPLRIQLLIIISIGTSYIYSMDAINLEEGLVHQQSISNQTPFERYLLKLVSRVYSPEEQENIKRKLYQAYQADDKMKFNAQLTDIVITQGNLQERMQTRIKLKIRELKISVISLMIILYFSAIGLYAVTR